MNQQQQEKEEVKSILQSLKCAQMPLWLTSCFAITVGMTFRSALIKLKLTQADVNQKGTGQG